MTNQATLPIWAKILLGMPTNNAVPDSHSELGTTADSSQSDSTPFDADATEQSVLVFDPTAQLGKRGWRRILHSGRREYSS